MPREGGGQAEGKNRYWEKPNTNPTKNGMYTEKNGTIQCVFASLPMTASHVHWLLGLAFIFWLSKSSLSNTLTWIQVVENVLNWLIRDDKDHLALVKPSVRTVHPLKRELPSLRWELLLCVLIVRSKIKVTDKSNTPEIPGHAKERYPTFWFNFPVIPGKKFSTPWGIQWISCSIAVFTLDPFLFCLLSENWPEAIIVVIGVERSHTILLQMNNVE